MCHTPVALEARLVLEVLDFLRVPSYQEVRTAPEVQPDQDFPLDPRLLGDRGAQEVLLYPAC